MCLGDSITQGSKQHPSYRYRLWKKLIDHAFDVEFVGTAHANFGGDPYVKGTKHKGKTYANRHEGHWGWTADEILNGKAGEGKLQNRLQDYTPDVVLMHLGTNDMFRNQPLDETVNELREIVRQLRADHPSVTIFIAQLIPADAQRVGPQAAQNIQLLNARIPALVQELHTAASPLILVDQFSGFDPTADTYDGVHPDGSGEEKMAQKWYVALTTAGVLPVAR